MESLVGTGMEAHKLVATFNHEGPTAEELSELSVKEQVAEFKKPFFRNKRKQACAHANMKGRAFMRQRDKIVMRLAGTKRRKIGE